MVPCKRDTLFCSKLHDMVSESESFCKSLGYKINDKTQFDDDFLLNLALDASVEPICYDLNAGSALWGKAPPNFQSKDGGILLKNLYTTGIVFLCIIIIAFI